MARFQEVTNRYTQEREAVCIFPPPTPTLLYKRSVDIVMDQGQVLQALKEWSNIVTPPVADAQMTSGYKGNVGDYAIAIVYESGR